MMQMPIGAEDRFQGIIDPIASKAYYFDGENGENIREEDIPAEYARARPRQRRQEIIERRRRRRRRARREVPRRGADHPTSELRAAIRRATIALKMTPVMCGSAYKNKGVQLLLDAVRRLPAEPDRGRQRGARPEEQRGEGHPRVDPDKPFVGLAFKLEDGRYGQLTYMRIYQGKVAKGDIIINQANQKKVEDPAHGPHALATR